MERELTQDGWRLDRRKIAAILDMPKPEEHLPLSFLLRMATYLAKLLLHSSGITSKLRKLFLPNVEFRWNNLIHGAVLRQLKEML
jgi:hypothetical protein